MNLLYQGRRHSAFREALEQLLAAQTQAVQQLKEEVRQERAQRERLEAQFGHVQKMAALGRLATGVAHDFNNILTVISGYSDVLRPMQSDPTAQLCVEELKKAAIRAKGLTARLLAYSRKQRPEPQVLNLNTRVRDMEEMLRRLLGRGITVVTELEPALALVCADPGQMDQVILNLAVNARDAMTAGGTLTIATENKEAKPESASADTPPGRYVVLTVRDTGCGMDEYTLAHIFEPFFTTKADGTGTGLGLATIGEIVRASGGHIGVVSRPGEGATFRIYLPAVAAHVAAG